MPRKVLMSWTGEPYFRWRKTYKGKRYEVYCSDLSLPREDWTLERSARAANEWWTRTLSLLNVNDGGGAAAKSARRKAEYAKAHGLNDEAELWSYEAEVLSDPRRAKRYSPLPSPADTEFTKRVLAITKECGEKFERDLFAFLRSQNLTQRQIDTVFGFGEVWEDRMEREPHTPDDKRVGYWADKWSAAKKDGAAVGRWSVGSSRGHVVKLKHFVKFVGAESSVVAIDEDKWAGWVRHLFERRKVREQDPEGKAGWSSAYCECVLKAARQFVRDLLEWRAIDRAPINLDKKTRLKVAKGVVKIDPAQVRLAVSKASGEQKLHLLLMANCAFTQMDIAKLKHDEVDWSAGTITRKRSKTAAAGTVPTVTYRLWKVTRQMLAKHRSKHPVLALVHPNGKPWVVDGGVDGIARAFRSLVKVNPSIKLTLKHIRKCSPQMLDSHKQHRHVSTLFVGHAPSSIKEKHYSSNYSQDELDEAVYWLGVEYGFEPTAKRGAG